MASGAARQGAADLAMLRAVFAHAPDAWALFVRQCQSDVYTACRMAFPDNEAKDVFVQVMAQLRADDFALLRAFDGRATISGYLRLVLRDVLSAARRAAVVGKSRARLARFRAFLQARSPCASSRAISRQPATARTTSTTTSCRP